MSDRQRVLFLCTGNCARSQMAEGFLRHIASDRFEVESAGPEAGVVHPFAIEAMREIGVDISGQRSKTLDSFSGAHFDYVITLCAEAEEACPSFGGDAKHLHWSFDDPVAGSGTDPERVELFRRVRDEIRYRVLTFRTIAR